MSKPLAILLEETGNEIDHQIDLVTLLEQRHQIDRAIKNKALDDLKEARGVINCTQTIIADMQRIKRIQGRLMEGFQNGRTE